MEIYVSQQTVAFLGAIALGAALGLIYDIFRITRIAFPTPKSIIFIEDILYFLICAVSTFVYLMSAIQGKVRVFLLLGMLIGSVLYFLTIGQIVMSVSRAIIEGIRRMILFLIHYIIRPFWKLIYQIVYIILMPIRFFLKIAKKNARKAKFHLKVRRVVLYNHFRDVWGKKSAEVSEINEPGKTKGS